MHTPTNYLLASMAVSDVFTIIIIAASRFAFSQHVLDENFGHLVCKASALSTTFITIFAIVSSTTLTVLAVERYNALLKPLRTGLRLNKDNVKKAIALIWVTSVLVSFPSVFFQEFEPVRSVCVGPRDSDIDLALKIYLILHTAMLLIQSVVMVFCYGSLIRGLYFTNTQFAQKLKPPMAREARRRKNLLSHSF